VKPSGTGSLHNVEVVVISVSTAEIIRKAWKWGFIYTPKVK